MPRRRGVIDVMSTSPNAIADVSAADPSKIRIVREYTKSQSFIRPGMVREASANSWEVRVGEGGAGQRAEREEGD